jgi:phospholipid-binding lipoprotein MlaA
MNRGSIVLLLVLASLAGCATPPPTSERDPRDRFERFNRGVYIFNDALDRAVARPVARTYVAITPRPVRTGVSNFLANLSSPVTIVNEVLQGKATGAGKDTARLLINTTIGIGGLFDPATKFGIEAGDEDFGQTLGRWGVASGPFLMLPFLGPSSVRDGLGKVGDHFTEPRTYIDSARVRWGLTGLELVDRRAKVLDADAVLRRTFDPYAFIRNAYLDRRQFQVYDGNPPEQPLEEFEDEPAPGGGSK